MKKLFTLLAMMAIALGIHAEITVINYELKDKYGDGWNDAALSVVDAETGQTLATLTISSGKESSGSVKVVTGHRYNIVWKSGRYDSECYFTLTDARGIVFLKHKSGESISAGTLLEYKVPIRGDVNGDFDVNIADMMDVVSYVINGDTSTPVQPPTPTTVDISYELMDAYGDSWNGAAIRIVDTDTDEEVAVLTIEDGDYSSGTVTLTAGHYYDFYWQSGEYDEECSFTLNDSDGGELYSYYPSEGPIPEPMEESMFAGVKKAKKPIKTASANLGAVRMKRASTLLKPDRENASHTKLFAGKKMAPGYYYDGKGTVFPMGMPVETGLYDGEVFFSYQAPGDGSSSTPSPSPTLLRDINGDKDVNISDVMQLVSMVIYGTPVPDIAVSKESIEILVYSGEWFNTIDITDGSGNFEAISSDPDKLKVYMSGLTFSLYCGTLGSYVVTIKDKVSGKTKDIQVVVKEAEPCCPDDNHPHIIDLGLPSGTKWACCNVDATSPVAFGGYYAWGETAEKTDYSWASYTHCDGSEETCRDLGSSIIGTKYDVAHYKWGDNWYMPSYDQVSELFRVSTSFYNITSMNGVIGAFFTFSNGNNIFLPLGGWKEGTEVHYKDDSLNGYGCYWLGTPPINASLRGDNLWLKYFADSGGYGYGYFSAGNHSLGYNVRPVVNEKAPLAVSTTAVEVEHGGNATVEITAGSGSYTVESSKANIATATLNGNTVIIAAVGGGTATITITDTQTGKKLSISVTVPASAITSPCPDDHHPHMIDLGLPSGTKWACCNVGANKPEGIGDHYAWGETEPKDAFPYEEGPLWYDTDIQGTEYDVARVKWGDQWQMPNNYDELEHNCLQEKAILNGVDGVLFTGPNGNSIFLPFTGGYGEDGEFYPSVSHYWESNGIEAMPGVAYCLYLYGDEGSVGDWWKYSGGSIRPISSEETVQLKLSESIVDLVCGETYYVDITEGSGSYSLYCEDEEIAYASIDDNKVRIFGNSVGSTSIYVADMKICTQDTIEVTVSLVAPYFYFSENNIVMEVGETAKVHYESNTDFGYSISDESVAVVDCSGGYFTITAVGPGSATIEVDYGNSGPTYHATLEVTVTAPSTSLCPDDNHPHMIDLGLQSGTKCACCNVDTDYPENQSPTNYGGYYAYGEAETKDNYTYSSNLGSNIAGTEFDVAYVRCGFTWQMPSKDQIDELLGNCSSDWITLNGVSGRKFTAANGGSIFLLAADLPSYEDHPWSATPVATGHPLRLMT